MLERITSPIARSNGLERWPLARHRTPATVSVQSHCFLVSCQRVIRLAVRAFFATLSTCLNWIRDFAPSPSHPSRALTEASMTDLRVIIDNELVRVISPSNAHVILQYARLEISHPLQLSPTENPPDLAISATLVSKNHAFRQRDHHGKGPAGCTRAIGVSSRPRLFRRP